MSLAEELAKVAINALPAVIEIVKKIASSDDQEAAANRALLALETDALDAATDKALDETLRRLNGQ